MITIVGTNHTFDISEPLSFIIKHIWPDVVLVELDQRRYNAMNAQNEPGKLSLKENKPEKLSWMYRSITRRQNITARHHKSYVGNDMFTAIKIGKFIGAEIGLIDTDVQNLIKDVWAEMSIYEKVRYFLSTIIYSVNVTKEDKLTTIKSSESEEKAATELRRKYPTIMNKLIDERNTHMTNQIKNYAKRFHNIVVVVGDSHIAGIVSLLKNYNIRKIRFRDIIDKNKFNNIRSEIWNNKGESNGN